MHIRRIVVRNFRNFTALDVSVGSGVTCIVGENNTGKTNLLEALRLVVDARLSSVRRQLTLEDFPVGTDFSTPQQVLISVEFESFAALPNQGAMVFGYEIGQDVARLTYRFRPSHIVRRALEAGTTTSGEVSIDDYRWEIVGGGKIDPAGLSWDQDDGSHVRLSDLQQGYLVVHLDALRDVEARLRQVRVSPVAQAVTESDMAVQERDDLIAVLQGANSAILKKSETLRLLGESFDKELTNLAGGVFDLGVRLGMAPPTFGDIFRGLTVILNDPAIPGFDFAPRANGLGMNNILFVGMMMHLFKARIAKAATAGQLLLLEEPEAHLHPQLQRVLCAALEKVGVQVILSSHGTHVTSRAPLDSMVVLSREGANTNACNPAAAASLTDDERTDLERYLDATRGTLLFAKRVLLVEGPAELMLIPPLVKFVMGLDLDEAGVSIVPIYGTHFGAYSKLFGPAALRKRCAILGDGDLKNQGPAFDEDDEEIVEEAGVHFDGLRNPYVETFICTRTFELELALPGLLSLLAATAADVGAPRTSKLIADACENDPSSEQLEKVAVKTLRLATRVGKARFAQTAARHARKATEIPSYIREAVEWLVRDDTQQ